MEVRNHNPKLVKNYLPMLRSLSANDKLDLAEMLIELVRVPEPPKSIEHLFGAWESDKSAEEMIEEIEGARTSRSCPKEEFIPEKSAEELIAELRAAR